MKELIRKARLKTILAANEAMVLAYWQIGRTILCLLLERIETPELRQWYAEQTVLHGWSRSILALQIDRQAHERQGKAITNFPATLPPADSDMAVQVFKDPYLFDFLGTADPRRERERDVHEQRRPGTRCV